MTPELLARLSGAQVPSDADRAALAGMAADPMAALRERLDPGLRELFDMMAARPAARTEETSDGGVAALLEGVEPIRLPEARTGAWGPRGRGAPTARMAFLEDVNRAAAGALGACHRCWGRDGGCPACGGHGLPGASAPDPELFRALVTPALRAMRAGRTQGGLPEAEPPPGGARRSAPAPAGAHTDQPRGDGHV